ncbi:MAG: flavodoxin reductase [Chitinophagaceae bacterium]|nr:MAG: flavodoxin reductase [Chitinophagaceae bacterium]
MEEQHIVKILSAEMVTHDVRRFKVEKPKGYKFVPGQATEICINRDKWKEERRPFTFTALNDWDHLEFTIKIYNDRQGVTHQLGMLKPGDELILHDVWGAIHYKGEGTFIAGGAGVTPFIAIFRQLFKDKKIGNNKLFFSNKTVGDIILKDEFTKMLGRNFINTITQEKVEGYDHRMIDESFLKDNIRDFNQNFYICGPDPMVQAMQKSLKNLGAADTVVTVEM